MKLERLTLKRKKFQKKWMAPMKKKVPAWVEKHFLCYCDFRPLRKWYYHSMTDKITLD